MNTIQQLITIATCVIGTMLTRFLPFAVFSSRKPTPRYIRYLGRYLPSAIFALLVVYCLKGVSLTTGTHGIPEFAAIAVTVLLHLWKRQMLLSMAGGTFCYIFMTQLIL